MPGLSDLHTHLSYGNGRSEGEVDLYGSLEYRAIRSLAAAQRMLRAGFTALLDPACARRHRFPGYPARLKQNRDLWNGR
jgi:imidazolonepropionase-like amidohydrolase